jgi:hypothetical protein
MNNMMQEGRGGKKRKRKGRRRKEGDIMIM